LGAATATTINGLTITGSAGTLTIPSNSLTLTTTAGTNVTLPTSGTLVTLAGTETLTNKTLTTPIISTIQSSSGVSLTLPTVTGTLANLVSPSFTTPTLGAATATTINSLTINGGTGTLTIPNSAALVMSGGFVSTLTSTAATNITLPITGTLATLDGTETLTNKTLTTPIISTIQSSSGVSLTLPTVTGALANIASPTFTGTVTAPTYLATTGITVGTLVTNSTYALYVNRGATGSITSFRYFTGATSVLTVSSTSTSFTGSNSTNSASIYAIGGIVSSTGFYAASDKRIKFNIHDFADIPSLQLLRYLKPRIFNFIDDLQYGADPTWGFIAQEVAEIIPNAVTYGPAYIPNIFEVAEIIGKEVKLGSKTISDLLKGEDGYYPLKIKNTNGEDKIVKIIEIIDEKTFNIDEEIETDHNRIFVYGQEVPDFHSLDKDAIFTITTSAVQELDKELQETNKRVKLLEEENQTLKQQINEIVERLTTANI
jgi:hypothetical protein